MYTPRKPGRPEKYPWSVWFNGEVHILKEGTDWPGGTPTENFRTTIHQAARRKHIPICTEKLVDGALKVWKVGDEGEEPLLREAPKETSAEVPVVELDGREPPHSHI